MNDDYNEGFADGVTRLTGCCVGAVETLKGRRDALRRSLEELDSTIQTAERRVEINAEAL